jgi:hypothetical protein
LLKKPYGKKKRVKLVFQFVESNRECKVEKLYQYTLVKLTNVKSLGAQCLTVALIDHQQRSSIARGRNPVKNVVVGLSNHQPAPAIAPIGPGLEGQAYRVQHPALQRHASPPSGGGKLAHLRSVATGER